MFRIQTELALVHLFPGKFGMHLATIRCAPHMSIITEYTQHMRATSHERGYDDNNSALWGIHLDTNDRMRLPYWRKQTRTFSIIVMIQKPDNEN